MFSNSENVRIIFRLRIYPGHCSMAPESNFTCWLIVAMNPIKYGIIQSSMGEQVVGTAHADASLGGADVGYDHAAAFELSVIIANLGSHRRPPQRMYRLRPFPAASLPTGCSCRFILTERE